MKKLRLKEEGSLSRCKDPTARNNKGSVKPDFASCGLLTLQLTFFPMDKLPLQVCRAEINLLVCELLEDRTNVCAHLVSSGLGTESVLRVCLLMRA